MFDGLARNNQIEILIWKRQCLRIPLHESGSTFLPEFERSLAANLQSSQRKIEPNRVCTLAREGPDKSSPSARNLKRSQSLNIDQLLQSPLIPGAGSVIVLSVQLVISGMPGVIFHMKTHRGLPKAPVAESRAKK